MSLNVEALVITLLNPSDKNQEMNKHVLREQINWHTSFCAHATQEAHACSSLHDVLRPLRRPAPVACRVSSRPPPWRRRRPCRRRRSLLRIIRCRIGILSCADACFQQAARTRALLLLRPLWLRPRSELALGLHEQRLRSINCCASCCRRHICRRHIQAILKLWGIDELLRSHLLRMLVLSI